MARFVGTTGSPGSLAIFTRQPCYFIRLRHGHPWRPPKEEVGMVRTALMIGLIAAAAAFLPAAAPAQTTLRVANMGEPE